jgi:hypothetical protein
MEHHIIREHSVLWRLLSTYRSTEALLAIVAAPIDLQQLCGSERATSTDYSYNSYTFDLNLPTY